MATEEMMRSFIAAKKEFDKHERSSAGCISEYYSQFMSIKMEALEYKRNTAATEGLKAENLCKNRYKDVIPYDESRVKLTPIDGVPGNDYVNASYVNGVIRDREYIAAMGPLPTTAVDFWRMVWQKEVHVIITACNEYEGCPKKKKCHRYWSQDTLEDVEFGDMQIKLDEESQESSDFLCRHMKISRGGEERVVSQLHYLSWPDRSVPSSVDSILSLITTMRQRQGSRTSPVLVHCSAGCGRTGTIIAVDYVWNLIRAAKLPEDFNLKSLILEMRQQRPAFVQAAEQYRFLHECVAELFSQHLAKVKSHVYQNCALNDDPDYATIASSSEDEVLYSEGSSEVPPRVLDDYSVALRLPEPDSDDTYAVPHKALKNSRVKVRVIPKATPAPDIPQRPVDSAEYTDVTAPEERDDTYSYVSAVPSGSDPLYEDISSVWSTERSLSSESSSSLKQNTFVTDLQEKSTAMGSNVGRQFNAFVKKIKTLKPNPALSEWATTQDAIEDIFYKGRNISFGHRVDRVVGPRTFVASSEP